MKSKTLHSICFGILIGILALPFLQERMEILPLRELAGVENPTDTIPLKWSTWADGSFQKNFNIRMYRWMGLRPAMVRLRNQVDYSFFGEYYRSIIIGKDGETFRRGSLNAYMGKDYIGGEKVAYHANHITWLQQFLATKGIRLMTVMTPSKLRCMPDGIDGNMLTEPEENNYRAFLKEFTKYQTDVLDFAPLLRHWVENDSNRVFPKTGTHWTDYGAVMSALTLLTEMQKRSGEQYLNFRPQGMTNSMEMRGTDADAGDLLNLIVDLPPAKIGYPTLQWEENPNKKRPRVLIIGDSFWWKIWDNDIQQKVFAPSSQYRYYNWEVFSAEWEGAKHVPDFDLKQSVENVDFVLLVVNEGNLHRFPFGFVDEVISLYQ